MSTQEANNKKPFKGTIKMTVTDGQAVLDREFPFGTERIEGTQPTPGSLQLEGSGWFYDRPFEPWRTRALLLLRGASYEGAATIDSEDGKTKYRDCTIVLKPDTTASVAAMHSEARTPANSAPAKPVQAPQTAATISQSAPQMGFAQTSPTYPIGTVATCWQPVNMVGCFTNMDKVFPMREVRNGASVLTLPVKRQAVTYRYKDSDYKAAEFLDHHRILGLLIIKNGEIVEEQYRYGTGPTTRFFSASMAKTVVGMLVGIALDKKIIKSSDDPAEQYVPELTGSAYGKVTIANLLRMSSGVRMTQFSDKGDSDENRFFQVMMGFRPQSVVDFLKEVPGDEFKPGSRFRYMSTDSVVLGYVLTRASGKTVSDLFSEWIWRYIGAEQNAQWHLMKDGVEYGGGNIFATLRDYGRLGIFFAHDGKVDGKPLIPTKWIEAGTDADEQPWAFKPLHSGGWFGYGHQSWIFPLRTRTFGLRGAWGQAIFVQPKSGIVMVITSALPTASNRDEMDERHALWYGVLRSLDGYTY